MNGVYYMFVAANRKDIAKCSQSIESFEFDQTL